MTTLLRERQCVASHTGIVGQEEVRLLRAQTRRPTCDASDRLAEEQRGRRRRRQHADTKARDVDAFADHAHRDDPRVVTLRELCDHRGCFRVVR